MYRKDKYEQRISLCVSLSPNARICKSIFIISVIPDSHGPTGQDFGVTVEGLHRFLWVNIGALQLGPWELFLPEGSRYFGKVQFQSHPPLQGNGRLGSVERREVRTWVAAGTSVPSNLVVTYVHGLVGA